MADGEASLGRARTDPRWVRTRGALVAAVVAAASERPIDRISLAELATAAGVSRSTVYEHAASARDLLETMLRSELEAIRLARFEGLPPERIAEATAAATRDVIEHVERYEGVYRRGLDPDAGAGSLHAMLSAQFAESVRMLLRAHDLDPGVPLPPGADAAVLEEIVVRGVADGAVGQISAWIAGPGPRDRELFLTVNARLLPTWWAVGEPPPRPESAGGD